MTKIVSSTSFTLALALNVVILITMLTANIYGFPGYEITSEGKVFSFLGRKRREMCPSEAAYLHVMLRRDGKSVTARIHRLVAEHFLERDPSRTFVNHKNMDKHDNRLENLEWCSNSENVRHWQWMAGRNGAGCHLSKLTGEQAIKVRCAYHLGGERISDLSRLYGIGHASIRAIVRGETYRNT